MKVNKLFKSRCSGNGKLTGKTGIGKTGQTYAKEWRQGAFFNRRKQIKNKYLERGNVSEAESIQFIEKMLKVKTEKNEAHFENDFFTGTPDMLVDIQEGIEEEEVWDVKNSWDWSTFPIAENEIPNSDYYDQLQGYMYLTGRRKARLIYVLLDTPEHLIEKEAWYYCKNLGLEELEFDVFEKFQKEMTYSDVKDSDRIKIFDIEYNEAHVELMKKRVLDCRKFLENN